MGQADSIRFPTTAPLKSPHGGATTPPTHATIPGGEQDPKRIGFLSGARGELSGLNWEAAWIDLGGEG